MPKGNEPTTKFKVDISELKSAMLEARKQVAYANSEFKAASSGMEDWSKSADGISAKLKQLNSNLKSQETVLGEYEKTLEEVKKEYGENSREALDYATKLNNQQAVVNKIKKEISQYEKALEDVGNESKDAGKGSKELADDIKDAANEAKNAEGGFTVLKGALASLLADGIKACIGGLKDLTVELITDGADAYAGFAAATGTATDAMGEYKDAINEVYKSNFGESLADVAEKMAKVKEVTGELDASKLEDMTKKAITLEDTFDMDMTETLRGVQSLMNHFGLTSTEAFDLIASGAQNGLNYTDELGDNVAEYAGKFAEAGYTSEEYFQLLKNGADGGAYNLDKVNDAVNEVTARLADGTIEKGLDGFSQGTQDIFKAWQNGEATQKDVIDSIVKDIQNTTGEQEKMNLAALAFGTMAEDGGTKFIEALSPVGDTFDDVKGKADELAAVKYDTPQAALQGIGRTLKVELLGPLVEKLMPKLNDLSVWVTENLPAFIEKVKELAGKAKEVSQTIADLSPLFAGLGTAIAGLGLLGLIQNIGAIGAAVKAWVMSTKLMTAAQWLLNTAMSANPIALVVIAIAGLVAAFIVLWNKSEAFREFWIGVWEGIKTACGDAKEWIGEKINEIGEFLTTTLPNFFTGLIDWVKTNWTTIFTFLINPFAGLFKYFYENNVKFKEFVDTAIKYIKELPGKVWEWLKKTIAKVESFFSDILSKAKTKTIEFISNIIAKVAELPGKMWAKLSEAITKVVTFFQNIISKAKEKAGEFITSFISKIKELPGKMWEKFKEAIAKVVDLGTKLKEKGQEAGKKLLDAVVEKVKSLPGDIKTIAGDVVTGLWNGIQDKNQWLKDKIGGWVGDVTSWVKKFFGIKSPSRVMRDQVGKYIAQGIAVGIDKNKGEVTDSLKALAKEAASPLNFEIPSAKARIVSGNRGYGGTVGGSSMTNNSYTFNQYNNSPRALSKLDIYRQTKNQLNFAKGV